MNDLMQDRNLPVPEYEEHGTAFIVTFTKTSGGLNGQLNGGLNGGLNEGQKTLFDAIKMIGGLNVRGLSEKINRPISTVEKQIRKLKEMNIIEYRGSKKTGGYFMKDSIKNGDT